MSTPTTPQWSDPVLRFLSAWASDHPADSADLSQYMTQADIDLLRQEGLVVRCPGNYQRWLLTDNGLRVANVLAGKGGAK